ncbi:MAG TPA: imidazolonepropionase [Steroidobacteraceae bacterium]
MRAPPLLMRAAPVTPESTVTLWRNARIASCDAAMRVYDPGAIVTRGERIEWVGAESALPPVQRTAAVVHDLARAWVTPGFIDCHTHLVFAADRASEYAQRLSGASYEQIARSGGGILSSVHTTRAATEDALYEQSAPRLAALLREGVTTVEIKSGYGLTFEHEAKMLRVARRLGAQHPVTVQTTFLAAHTLPPEFTGQADRYIDTIAAEWLPALQEQGLIDAVDVFCDRIGFTAAQSERLLRAARARGLPVKMHAEQLANIGGSQVAASLGALSCDHLEHASEADAAALARAGTVAVLLPIAFYFLQEPQHPPLAALRRHGVPVAVATDCNPGSAPGTSLLLALHMGCRLFGLSSSEALRAVTANAARALGLGSVCGTLEPGRRADFAVWDLSGPDELVYWLGRNSCRAVIQAGRRVAGSWQ